jgi:hypothetical protein
MTNGRIHADAFLPILHEGILTRAPEISTLGLLQDVRNGRLKSSEAFSRGTYPLAECGDQAFLANPTLTTGLRF